MAILLHDDDIISLSFDALHDGQQLLLTTHWRVANSTPSVGLDWDEVQTAWVTYLDALGNLGDQVTGSYSEDVTDINYVFQRIYPTRNIKFKTVAAHDVGQVVEPSFPPNVAHAVVIRADVAGPHNKGVKHIGGVPLTYSEAGLITATGLAQLSNLGDALRTVPTLTVTAATFDLIPLIFNRAAPLTSVVAEHYAVGSATRTMRRRTVGLGS